ncbi:phospholipase D family protein [Pontiella agarivorans]|uniref:phospholipase D family protein n=1 Tax=Pontiella agarivorans TaxID=3038953 RepID=UPI002AD531ED|nr:phospholipase D family protein [Pontiella agarivorans]
MIGLALALLTGCSTIPERDLENAFTYQRLKRYEVHEVAPIESEFIDLASKAWKNKENGNPAQYISILELGDDALLARVHLIRAAKRSIDLQTFIWKDDATSRFVFDELVRAAERGVLVRMLIDAMVTPADSKQLARMARAHHNLEIALYKPMAETSYVGRIGFWKNLAFKSRRMNRRMHNKLLLIDGQVGISGGRNYQDRYFDRDTDFLFRDRDVVVAGPAVRDMQDSFELFWQDKDAVFLTQFPDVQKEFKSLPEQSGRLSDPADAGMFEEISRLADAYSISSHRNSLSVYEADRVSFVYDTPRKFRGRKERLSFDEYFEAVLLQSEERLVYQTPYLIYSRDQRRAFKALRKTNPKFRIIASSNSLASADHLPVYGVSFKHRKELYQKAGIDIYEAKPFPAAQREYVYDYDRILDRAIQKAGITDRSEIPHIERAGPILCIHSKSFVLDGRITLIGSHNFDPRSAKLNTECGVFIFDEEVSAVLEKRILEACEPSNAWTVSKGKHTPVISHFSGFVGTISTALPVFDVWPYRYTTNYELKDGCAVLGPRDPDFKNNYTDVGYFPEVESSVKVIQTRLAKGFLGWGRPFM